MDIYVLDSSTQILDTIDTFKSNIWTVQYFDTNDFELVVPATDKNIDLLQKDRLLCRDKDRDGDIWQNVMIIENIKIVADWEDGNKMTVSGRGLKSIVGRRVIWKQTNLTGKVETGIRQVITENIINPDDEKRKIDNFILNEPAPTVPAAGHGPHRWKSDRCGSSRQSCDQEGQPASPHHSKPCKTSGQRGAEDYGEKPWWAQSPPVRTAPSFPPIFVSGTARSCFW